MSDPFRSELETLQEKVRRAEEEHADLRRENARLKRARPIWYYVFTVIATALVTAFVTFLLVGDVNKLATVRIQHEAALRCGNANMIAQQNLDDSDVWLAACAKDVPPRSAIAKILAEAKLDACWKHDRSDRVRVTVTFQNDGTVTDARVDTWAEPEEKACVANVFRDARVPPFSGDPIVAGKSYRATPEHPTITN